ncbi:MAG: type II toxin-antitoxin system RelE/ParE family toxin [Deltaproteobacteria bacterium]|nr:type II toxin-antitoxin system RelE/ParE family toxin [Deltaproteobacteria bacterium]
MKVVHWTTSRGEDVIAEFLQELSIEVREDYFDLVSILKSGKFPEYPKNKLLTSIAPGLGELRLRDATGIYRFFYFLKRGEAVYVLHAMQKKTQKITERDRELILQRMRKV